MIRELNDKEQIEFDKEISRLRANEARNIFGAFAGTAFRCSYQNSYTNNVHERRYGDKTVIVKTPRFYSDMRFNTHIAIHKLSGKKGFKYANTRKRIQHEKEQLEFLSKQGCNVPQTIYTTVDDVLITEDIGDINCKDGIRQQPYSFLTKATQSLEEIHRYAPHGDPCIANAVYNSAEDKVYWVDFDFMQDDSVPIEILLAQDIANLIFSTMHPLKGKIKQQNEYNAPPIIREVVDTVFANYRDREILKLTPDAEPIIPLLFPIYMPTIHFISPLTAGKVKDTLERRVRKL